MIKVQAAKRYQQLGGFKSGNKESFVPFFDRNGSNSYSQRENGMTHIYSVMMSSVTMITMNLLNQLRSCGECTLHMRKEERRRNLSSSKLMKVQMSVNGDEENERGEYVKAHTNKSCKECHPIPQPVAKSMPEIPRAPRVSNLP